MVVLLGTLVSIIEDNCIVPFGEPLRLLLSILASAYQEARLQMVIQSVLGKDGALLIVTLLHVDIGLLLQIGHPAETVMEE